ncbi:DUF5105 domain-containing protein [Fusobacterium hwasookii]|uniref:DUF5105 domain-containing protein n=1 Tax=Fusobacterium hwasookii ChDC F206 TaxID=1307443 RepID=A0AAC9A1Q6_9FUSO|nr:DUF5105 domain-containing protein [Fusobacterium hwasookii]ALQ35646.1 hypothetical protein RN92_06975 [Fusobacterium hwasookii ChDC F206]ALQ37721.1 hypothetical protein RN97_05740 [Fusobacterium hwasookii ChDC F300]QNE69379.1 DUF5105 domain-containing protein [Fusobacterium hwasookii]QYR54601.1 DUF5105 domain-containing protein [Fusobacterium hwasookii]
MKKIFRYLILCFAVLMLVACGKPDSQKAFEERFKEFNSTMIANMEGADEGSKKMAEIINKATYKVNKVEEKGDSSELNITVKAVNLGKYINEYIAAATEKYGADVPADKQEEFNKFSVDFFTNVANDKNVEYIETEVNIQMQKSEEGWRITNPEALVSAVLGGAGGLIGF